MGDVVDRVKRLKISDLQHYYEQDKQRLIFYQQMYGDIKQRLDRERVLEGLQLINSRAQLEEKLEQISATIAVLSERKAQYDQIFE